MSAVKAKSQAIGELIEWLNSERGANICEQHHHGPECDGWDDDRGRFGPSPGQPRCDYQENEWYPVHRPIEKLLADYFGINLKKIEAERLAILEYVRQNQQ